MYKAFKVHRCDQINLEPTQGRKVWSVRNNNQILVVDDDEYICETLADVLELNGYDVHTALTGREGVEKAEILPIGIVIIDIKLPDIDGVELLKKIKTIKPESHCIMATGYADLQTSIKSLNEGAYSYMMKPLEMEDVLSTIKRALEDQMLRQRLKVSEKIHREFVENSIDGILRFNITGEIISVNTAFCKLLEHEPHVLLGKSTSKYLWSHSNRRNEMMELLMKFGKIQDFEFEVRTKSGKIKTVSNSARAIYDDDGRIKEIEGILRDITEKKDLARKLQESEERYRAILERAPVGIMAIDKSGTITAINPFQLKHIDGGNAEEYVDKFNTLEFNRENNPELFPYVKDILNGKECELRAVPTTTVNGMQIYVHFTGNPIYDEKKEIVGAVLLSEDVTESVRAEEDLRYLVVQGCVAISHQPQQRHLGAGRHGLATFFAGRHT